MLSASSASGVLGWVKCALNPVTRDDRTRLIDCIPSATRVWTYIRARAPLGAHKGAYPSAPQDVLRRCPGAYAYGNYFVQKFRRGIRVGNRTLAVRVSANDTAYDGALPYRGSLSLADASGFPSHGTFVDMKDGAVSVLLQYVNLRALTTVRS